ncbi:MAG: hypothetical protein K8I27_09535 [Planctomycetes bacterium]|nr:hypothetical protein [Planctomycetota bacterium]
MSTSGQTSVSNMRAPGASRRGDTKRISGRRFGLGGSVHIVILALAILLWWIARDMVAVSRTLTDAGRVQFSLSDELAGKWRVYSDAELPISLEVSGPTKEINVFASSLEQVPGRFAYRYQITPGDLAGLEVNSRRQLTLTVDLRRVEATGEAVAPSELAVRPQADSRVFEVVLEEFVQREAYFDLADTAKGQIQVNLPRSDGRQETRSYSYTAEVENKNIEVYGPYSLVTELVDQAGKARLKLTIDAKQAVENVAKTEREPIEDVLRREVVSVVPLVPVEGVVVRSGENKRQITELAVRLKYDRLQDYVQVTRDFPVEVVLPNWLAQKSARVENLPSFVKVDMKVLSSQQTSFTENHVHVRLDLSTLSRGDLTNIEPIEGTALKRTKVLNWYYSLEINTERLTYEFVSDRVTAEQYLPIGEITIVWTE